MAELIAQGKKPQDRWRRPLPEGEAVVLGREAPPWSVPWDMHISRKHVTLLWSGGRLRVERLPTSRNPIFFHGEPLVQFEARPGEQFVIGETAFVVAEQAPLIPPPAQPDLLLQARTFSAQELKQIKYRDAGRQLDALSRLPEVVATAAGEIELYVGLSNLLLAGIPGADAVALVRLDTAHGGSELRIEYRDRRNATDGEFRPSKRLVSEAVRRQEAVLHVWGGGESDSFTIQTTFDWAFCTPLRGEAGAGLAIYVAGRFAGDTMATVLQHEDAGGLLDDLKFTELVASLWGALRQVDSLKRRQASLSHFFSPAVLRTLQDADPDEVLKPRQAEVTVLFCDLRGFSRKSEELAGDLLALLERVSKALGLMTQNILDQGGVIGDFHGDAAMGFWGWPLPQPDAAVRAARAALGIQALFGGLSLRSGHALSGFTVGVGLATGPAVAGKIGSADQVKVTVFGPVVNLASRLEGMTKLLRVPILLDEATAAQLRAAGPACPGRLRPLAIARPYGLATPLTVTELRPPASEDHLLTEAHLATHEAALEAFIHGNWTVALERLYQLPPQDQGMDFLMSFILSHQRTPPPGWDGVIPMESKG